MATHPGIRRFLRFSLRTLLLVTLAVAAWLEVEVHYGRTVEQQAEAIRALGGDVEFEPSRWSLLRFIEPRTYGRQVVAVQVPADRMDDAVGPLKSLPALRRVRVAFDGTTDVRPTLERLRAELGRKEIIPVGVDVPYADGQAGGDAEQSSWLDSKRRRRYQRFAEKMKQSTSATVRNVAAVLDKLIENAPNTDGLRDEYRLLRLRDGSLAELLVPTRFGFVSLERVAAMLLVDDHCVDVKCIDDPLRSRGDLLIEDIDGDGYADLALKWSPYDSAWSFPQRHPGDQRLWAALYAIEPTGLRNLLPKHPESLRKEFFGY